MNKYKGFAKELDVTKSQKKLKKNCKKLVLDGQFSAFCRKNSENIFFSENVHSLFQEFSGFFKHFQAVSGHFSGQIRQKNFLI